MTQMTAMTKWTSAIVMLLCATLCGQGNTIDPEQVRENRNTLRLTAISGLPSDSPAGKADLQETIHRLDSLRPSDGKPVAPPPEPIVQNEVVPETQPVASQPVVDDAAIAAMKAGSIAGLAKPVLLADRLYNDGMPNAALPLYEVAFKQSQEPQERVWALLQMGNCLQEADPAKAREHYQLLAKEHPDCPWSQVALQMDRLLEWKLADQPSTMVRAALAKLKSQEQ